jgi:hypothetical protein
MPVLETHEIRGAAVTAADLQNLADPVDVANRPAVDMKAVTNLGLHGVTSARLCTSQPAAPEPEVQSPA